MDFTREEMIQKQPTSESKELYRKSIDNSKKKPTKRKHNKSAEVKRDGNKVSDDERNHEAKVPKTKQCMNSAIAPIIRRQAGNPSSSFLKNTVHHAILQLPLQPGVIDKDSLLSHFQTTRPFTAAHSMPLHTTPGLGPSTPDLMVHALHTKQTYLNELSSLEKRYKNVTTTFPLHPNDGEHVQHTVALVYATLLDRDPDPCLQISTGYDYHYTGGTLVAIRSSSNGADGCTATIFKAIGASLEDVEVLRIGVSAQDDFHCDGDLKVSKVQSCPVGMIGPILEIVPNHGGTVMLVRKRNVIIFLREVDASPGVKEWRVVQKIFSANAFASVCCVTGPAPCETLTLCTTDYQHQLQLWIVSDDEASCEDIVKLPPARSATGKTQTHRIEDNWSAVRSVDGHSLVACLNRKVIRFYTILKNTSPNSEPDADTCQLVYCGGSDFSSWTYGCELCCALETTPSKGLLFIATCHKLIVAKIEEKVAPALEEDDRANVLYESGKETIELKVLVVFTHNLMQRPVFISHQWDATTDQNKEHHFVLFGCHLPMNYGMASFTRSGSASSVYAAQHYPYHPPTFHDTYKLAQQRGFCLSAYEPLQKRFNACISGAVLIRGLPRDDGEEEPRLHILLQTSAGDLLQQRISYNFERTEENVDRVSVEAQKQQMAVVLQHWHDTLVKQAGKIPYPVTSFRTMKKFRDIFNCPIGGNELNQILLLPDKKRKRVRRKASQTAHNGDNEEETQSEQEDAERLRFSIRDGTSTSSDSTSRFANHRRQKFGNRTPIPWRQTVEELQQYRDVLAPPMLAVWGIGNDVTPGLSTNAVPVADNNERVGRWVDGTASELCKLEDIAEEYEAMDDSSSVCKTPAIDTVTDEHNSDDLFSQSQTLSHTFAASQLSQQVEQPEKTNAKPMKKAYSKGF